VKESTLRLRTYFARRLIYFGIVLLFFSLLFFSLIRLIPGDPARFALGEWVTEEAVEKLRKEMGLDQPAYIQYFTWLKDLLIKRKVGMSIMTWRDASYEIVRYFPATLELVTIAVVFAVMIGVPLGVISAMKSNKWVDHATRIFAIGGVSMPRFFIGIMLQVFVSYGLRLLPVTGRIEVGVPPPNSYTGLFLLDSLLSLNFPAFVSCLKCIFLPALTLALSPLAIVVRMVRATIMEEATMDYTNFMLANGLPPKILQFKYMLKGAISPVITCISLTYMWLLGNAFVVETVFSWPGVAKYGLHAAINKDINALMGVSIFMCASYLIVNFGLELAHAYIDPRMRKM